MASNKIHIPDFKPYIKPALNFLKYAAVIAALILTIGLILDNLIMPGYTRHGSEYPLPNLINKSFDEAQQLAESYKFEIVVQGKQASPTIPEGTVISQIPAANTQIKENRKVKVIISAGEQMVEIPELSRYSIRQAELKVAEYSLKVSNYYWTETDSLAPDVIAYTIPPAGALVPRGAGIDLYINRGMVTDEGYMPKLLGKSLAQATTMLDSLGFPSPRVEYVTNPLLLPQIITYQHPAAGTKLKIDSADILIVVPVGD